MNNSTSALKRTHWRRSRLSHRLDWLIQPAKAVLVVAITTGVLLAIGREHISEAVIALLYVVPVGWSTSRWGQAAGLSAAVAAALAIDFFFIPPFYTFVVGSLEGWIILALFLAIALLVVGRMQSGLARAQAGEREAMAMYELSTALAEAHTPLAVAHTLARQLHKACQASRVEIILRPQQSWPDPGLGDNYDQPRKEPPDCILPIMHASRVAGEIWLWHGAVRLPPAESRLLQNFASQAGHALKRARQVRADQRLGAPPAAARAN